MSSKPAARLENSPHKSGSLWFHSAGDIEHKNHNVDRRVTAGQSDWLTTDTHRFQPLPGPQSQGTCSWLHSGARQPSFLQHPGVRLGGLVLLVLRDYHVDRQWHSGSVRAEFSVLAHQADALEFF